MAWQQAKLTTQGRALLAAVMAGKVKLTLTEVWFGSGVIQNQETATDLGNKQIQAAVSGIEQQGTNCVLSFRLSNKGQTKNIILSELGFYALDASGNNILLSSAVDPDPATLPAQKAGDAEYVQSMTMAFGYSNAENVTLNPTIVDGLTQEQVDKRIGLHLCISANKPETLANGSIWGRIIEQ